MTWRIVGYVATAVGAVGLMFSIYAGVKTWSIAGQVREATDVTLTRLQAMIDPVKRQSESAISIVGVTRERFDSIRASVERFGGDDEPQQPPAASILENLDEQIVARLEGAEEFIRVMQGNLRTASSALLMLDSVPFFSPRLASDVTQGESQLRTLASDLTEISNLLDQVMRTIANIRSQSAIDPEQMEQLRYGLAQIDARLGELAAEVQRFSEGIDNVDAILSHVRQQAPARITAVAAGFTIFFVCFGCSQLSLLAQGYRMANGRP